MKDSTAETLAVSQPNDSALLLTSNKQAILYFKKRYYL
jgi:hypothetical protein